MKVGGKNLPVGCVHGQEFVCDITGFERAEPEASQAGETGNSVNQLGQRI